MSIVEHKKSRRGRPAVETDLIRSRVHRDVIDALDGWGADQSEPVSRPEAIRLILTKFLRSKGYLAK